MHHSLELLELLKLLKLLHLEKFKGVSSGRKAVVRVGYLRVSDVGLSLHEVSSLLGDDSKLLHEFNDGDFHFFEDLHQIRISKNDIISNILHEVFFFKTVFLVYKIVKGQSEKHGDKLIVFRSLFESSEKIFEVISLILEFSNLIS